MKTRHLIDKAEYLGHCKMMGDIYSILRHTNHQGYKIYQIWAVHNGQSSLLIEYEAE